MEIHIVKPEMPSVVSTNWYRIPFSPPAAVLLSLADLREITDQDVIYIYIYLYVYIHTHTSIYIQTYITDSGCSNSL